MLPQLFLDLARELADQGGPAECRSAISRAYYAVYNACERFLERMLFKRPKKDYHIILQRRLLVSGDAEIIRIGSDLHDLHQERIQADYHLEDHDPENRNNAAAAVLKAGTMIETIEKCPINGTRWEAIRNAIAKANVTGTDKPSP